MCPARDAGISGTLAPSGRAKTGTGEGAALLKKTGALSRTALLLFGCIAGVSGGVVLWAVGYPAAADGVWAATSLLALVPVLVSMVRDLIRRSGGVDLIAVMAIIGAVALGEYLAGAVIGLMLATGRALEEYASNRAERELSSLLKRAPRTAYRLLGGTIEAIPVERVASGDLLVVKEGDVLPVDGIVTTGPAVLDESALTGESRLVVREIGDRVRSGTANAGSSFQMRALANASGSTYAGIVRMVEEAQKSSAPLVRLADRYAWIFVPAALATAGIAWGISGDPVRALAVLVVATPCPLLLAAPVAIVSGVSRREARDRYQGWRGDRDPRSSESALYGQDRHHYDGCAARPSLPAPEPRLDRGRTAEIRRLARSGVLPRARECSGRDGAGTGSEPRPSH